MKHIPNVLSFSRILLVPVFIMLMIQNNTLAAGIVLAVSGLTDLLDGLLARKFHWVSQLGKILDPAADKLTQVTVCVVLAIRLQKYWPCFLVILAKELAALILGGYLLARGAVMDGAKWFGKIVTVIFYLVMGSIVFVPSLPSLLITGLLLLVTLGAVAAGLLYIPDFLQYTQQAKRRDSALAAAKTNAGTEKLST